MIQVGDIVRIGSRAGAWVTLNLVPSPNSTPWWRLVQNGTSFTAAESELHIIVRPTFAAGDRVIHNDEPGTVIEDLGETVRIAKPDRKRALRRGGAINFGPGRCDAHRGHLVAENISTLMKGAPS